MNAKAPEFIPGRSWAGADDTQESPPQPLIVYSNFADYQRAQGREPSNEDEHKRKVPHHPSTPTSETVDAKEANVIASKTQFNVERLKMPEVDNTALAAEARYHFDAWFGRDEHNLQAWQDICYFCGTHLEKMPMSIRECKLLLRKIHVNIFDFVNAVRMNRVLHGHFNSARELEIYSRQNGKICPVAAARGNQLFRFMLKKWF